MNREQAVKFLILKPYKLGHLLGFVKLKPIHNRWIIKMIKGKGDKTLQASRGTYKTTCVSIALALIMILLPNKRIMFMRKTDTDVKEVIKQVAKILKSPQIQVFVQAIYGVQLRLVVESATEISTNLTSDIKGTSQLIGIGMGSSLTGKHFDIIFTDDIVNINDRISKAERERTKTIYQELQNVKNRGGRIFNTGTPWHAQDCFSIMPEAEKYNCYHEEIKEIISDEELVELKKSMTASLFSANYELRHIASEDVIFDEPMQGASIQNIKNGLSHVDSAFNGEDYTAFTIMNYYDGKLFVLGKMWRKHVEDCYDEIIGLWKGHLCGKLYTEDNADKGFVARDLKNKGVRTVTYSETMNKHIKIVTYLKAIWKYIVFVDGTDPEYIEQICDYTEDAEHDDAPDSCACLARLMYRKVIRDDPYQMLKEGRNGNI